MGSVVGIVQSLDAGADNRTGHTADDGIHMRLIG